MELRSQWVAIIVRDDSDVRLVESTFGPFTKDEAQARAQQFNEEYDGSPWCALVRPMIKIKI
jgi:hypothetical protein